MDRPILFSAPMVRALLDGTKTQTRRVIKDQSLYRDTTEEQRAILGERGEVWTGFMGWQFISTALANRGICGRGCLPSYAVGARLWVREAHYLTDDGDNEQAVCAVDADEASRLTLTVTDVRVQRLQDISVDDAEAEGVRSIESRFHTYVSRYKDLWNSLNAGRGFGWEVNPWVVAVSFTVERRNIDEAA